MHFDEMKATLTELRRDTRRILGKVIHGQEAVALTQHGQTVASIQPCPRPMSGTEFAAAWKARKPLGKETADDMAKVLQAIDQAA
jgi:antitoxin (DNA-binding transcriptional repressor) of toxin-antitoxin stability system